jgi:hypothetical protein
MSGSRAAILSALAALLTPDAQNNLLLGQSPPQFDNTTKLATMAAVQTARGSFNWINGLSASTTLTNAHAGSLIEDGTSGAASTYTLPAANGVLSGTAISFVTINGNGCVVQRAGTDVINVGGQTGGATATSMTLKVGDTLTLVSNGSNGWYVQGGSAQLPFSGLFAASLAVNGYQKLPSGLIIQWGQLVSNSSGLIQAAFPIAFPSACLSAVVNYIESGNGLGGVGQVSSNTTKTIIQANCFSSTTAAAISGGAMYYIAVGC